MPFFHKIQRLSKMKSAPDVVHPMRTTVDFGCSVLSVIPSNIGRRTGQPSTPPLRAIPDQCPTNESEHGLPFFPSAALNGLRFSVVFRGRRTGDETGGPTKLQTVSARRPIDIHDISDILEIRIKTRTHVFAVHGRQSDTAPRQDDPTDSE